jgi:hypothetical protein
VANHHKSQAQPHNHKVQGSRPKDQAYLGAPRKSTRLKAQGPRTLEPAVSAAGNTKETRGHRHGTRPKAQEPRTLEPTVAAAGNTKETRDTLELTVTAAGNTKETRGHRHSEGETRMTNVASTVR